MKICHISTEKGFRGGERQLVRIHEGILASGEESIIICRSDNTELSQTNYAHGIAFKGFGTLVAPLQILRILIAQKPDLIHCHDSRALSLVAILKPFLKSPVVVSRKTVYSIANTGATKRKFTAVDHLIAVSHAAAEVVADRFPTLPVTVIFDGVVPYTGKSRSEVRAILGVSESITLFATVGYFSTEKNVPLLRKTADFLAQSFPNAKIVLIGPVAEKFLDLVENHSSILLAGKIENAETLYAGFDCYLSASTREGLGSALLDAVVRDIPAIALDSGGSRDIFAPNDTAHCENESAFLACVKEFCEGSHHLGDVVKRGISARNRFSIENLQTEHIALYRSLINQSRNMSNVKGI